MAGNKSGGLKAAEKNTKRDPDFYKRIGAMGGKASSTGGFYANRELARTAGQKGGTISRRKPVVKVIDTVTPFPDERPKASWFSRIKINVR